MGALAWFYLPQWSPQLALAYALLFMVLYSAAVIDFKHLILPDALVFTGALGRATACRIGVLHGAGEGRGLWRRRRLASVVERDEAVGDIMQT